VARGSRQDTGRKDSGRTSSPSREGNFLPGNSSGTGRCRPLGGQRGAGDESGVEPAELSYRDLTILGNVLARPGNREGGGRYRNGGGCRGPNDKIDKLGD